MEENTASSNGKKIVLIVEDDDFLRSLAVTKLQKEGFEVEVATEGQSGLQKVLDIKPDLLLLDLMLPNLDGFGIMEKLQGNEVMNNMPIVVFSNLGSDDDISRGMELGAKEYLVKSSFTLDELILKVNEVLGM